MTPSLAQKFNSIRSVPTLCSDLEGSKLKNTLFSISFTTVQWIPRESGTRDDVCRYVCTYKCHYIVI